MQPCTAATNDLLVHTYALLEICHATETWYKLCGHTLVQIAILQYYGVKIGLWKNSGMRLYF